MKVGVRIKLDVTKIDKNLLFKGAKGTYLDATVFVDVDEKDQYDNNGMITQDTPKDSQDKGNILGNVQVFWRDDQQGQQGNQGQQGYNAPPPDFEDDIPF